VSLATSFYSDSPEGHAAITRSRASYRHTCDNIAEAVRRGKPPRAGIIHVLEGQRVAGAREELIRLGVPAGMIGFDTLRGIGRGADGGEAPDASQLCGNCVKGRVAITSTGEVYPCVFSRWLSAGNVHTEPLAGILAGDQFGAIIAGLEAEFGRRALTDCTPDGPCWPDNACNPDNYHDGDDGLVAVAAAPDPCSPDKCWPDADCTPDAR